MVFVYALNKQCADGSTENRCSESCLSDLSDEFLASISYTTKLLSKSHMHGYLSKKLLLNITIVLRNVLYLSIQQFALCSCSSVLFALGPMWIALTLLCLSLGAEGRESACVTPNGGCWGELPELTLNAYICYG